MRENGLRALHGYRTRRLSVSKPAVLIPNILKRQFTVIKPNRVWVTDIAYIRTWQGWLYLAVVMGLFSRRIVGWSTSATIRRELVLDAVLMAIRQRRPKRTMIHSDQGTQYGSDAWRRFCKTNRLEPSMSRRGNCWDNAVAESFFGSLKKERIKKVIYHDREVATRDIADYIESFYSRTRRHSHLGGVSPEQFKRLIGGDERVSTKSWELQLRTVFLCDYFLNDAFRRELLRVLNRGEAVNALKRAIYTGRVASYQAKQPEEMQAVADALSLLANIVMAWNTAQMQCALEHWAQRPSAAVPPELIGRIAPTRT